MSSDVATKTDQKIRYAVVGLGHIAQVAVIPAFAHAEEKCQLTGLISDDVDKVKELSEIYKVKHSWSYEQFDDACASRLFDAVYIALPNNMHKEFAIRAANAGIHVLCEKPMAVTSRDCVDMIEAARANEVKLMIAYRLHFERTNMKAVEIIESGSIGKPRFFNSSFSMQVKDDNIRTSGQQGGGPLNDIGIYCINAARYLFRQEPQEVTATFARSGDPRFSEVEEAVSVCMRFPGEKLATFVCSFGASDMQRYDLVGTEGSLSLEPAYEYAAELAYVVKKGNIEEKYRTPRRDQFAPELLHFAECIIEDKEPRPSGAEGWIDITIIEAIREAGMTGKAVLLNLPDFGSKPDWELVKEKPPVVKPPLVNVESGSK